MSRLRFAEDIVVIHRCGFCGEEFQINDKDPHWRTGRGPLCPNVPPVTAPALTADDLVPTQFDHVIKRAARCKEHNTIRIHANEPCWKCWNEKVSTP